MTQITANNVTLEYENEGARDAPAMLLIMGFGAQLTLWPDDMVAALVGHGFRVIRYDNRDVGLSQKFTGQTPPGAVKQTLARKLRLDRVGLMPKVPYTLRDLADDAIGLLDALEIDVAHIVGASMGGMIAQHVAAHYPERCLSLTTIFSTTGNPALPQAKREALAALVKRPESTDEAALVEHGIYLSRTIGSPGFPAPEEHLRERSRAAIRRSFYPEGPTRHLAAILDDGDRRALIKDIRVPTLVLHGEDDPLVPVEGGRDIAATIPGAKLKTIPGWGHDLPAELLEEVTGAIADHAHVNKPL
ncbi:MAG: alpha/beta fold hydrolase [Parerythrobacter sp.]